MRSGGGKQKGAAWERVVAAQLSLWISHGQSKDLLWRSSMSGGRATIAARSGRLIKPCGDLCAIDPLGHQLTDVFFIETKHLNRTDFLGLILHYTGPLREIWIKAQKQAAQHNRLPMLILKENHKPPIVVTETGTLDLVCHGVVDKVTNDVADITVSRLDEVTGSRFGIRDQPPKRIPR